ncbi:MAG: chlorohydrolase, partial [bacterium]|nr:chlorohydrolase [bacterium]
DLIIKDYIPPTPIAADNLIGHFLFGITNSQTSTTICNGKILMEDYKLKLKLDPEEIYRKSNELAKNLWKRI